MCQLWALHVVKKQRVFFTFIHVVTHQLQVKRRTG